MTKGTNFKFGIFAPRESPVDPEFFFEKGAWPDPRDPLNFVGVKC